MWLKHDSLMCGLHTVHNMELCIEIISCNHLALIIRPSDFVARMTRSVAVRSSCITPWVRTTLVQFLERFGLVDLQERHDMHSGSSFSTSCVSLARQRGRELTRSGGETRITLPTGSGLGTQLHRHRPLHWGELHILLRGQWGRKKDQTGFWQKKVPSTI